MHFVARCRKLYFPTAKCILPPIDANSIPPLFATHATALTRTLLLLLWREPCYCCSGANPATAALTRIQWCDDHLSGKFCRDIIFSRRPWCGCSGKTWCIMFVRISCVPWLYLDLIHHFRRGILCGMVVSRTWYIIFVRISCVAWWYYFQSRSCRERCDDRLSGNYLSTHYFHPPPCV